jgi:hypothetical protein
MEARLLTTSIDLKQKFHLRKQRYPSPDAEWTEIEAIPVENTDGATLIINSGRGNSAEATRKSVTLSGAEVLTLATLIQFSTPYLLHWDDVFDKPPDLPTRSPFPRTR